MKRTAIRLFVFLLSLSAQAALAQTSEFLDQILASGSITTGQAAWLVLVAADKLGEQDNEARALELAGELWGIPQGRPMDDPIGLSSYSYMLMRAFGLRGSIMYSLAPGPHYAYRSLASLQVIQGLSDPGSPLDGETAIRMLSMVMDLAGSYR